MNKTEIMDLIHDEIMEMIEDHEPYHEECRHGKWTLENAIIMNEQNFDWNQRNEDQIRKLQNRIKRLEDDNIYD